MAKRKLEGCSRISVGSLLRFGDLGIRIWGDEANYPGVRKALELAWRLTWNFGYDWSRISEIGRSEISRLEFQVLMSRASGTGRAWASVQIPNASLVLQNTGGCMWEGKINLRRLAPIARLGEEKNGCKCYLYMLGCGDCLYLILWWVHLCSLCSCFNWKLFYITTISCGPHVPSNKKKKFGSENAYGVTTRVRGSDESMTPHGTESATYECMPPKSKSIHVKKPIASRGSFFFSAGLTFPGGNPLSIPYPSRYQPWSNSVQFLSSL